jgi:hypothetical protein
MLIINCQDVEICFVPGVGSDGERLELIYQQQKYDFVQAFYIDKLTTAIHTYQQLTAGSDNLFLLIREAKYYSIWRSKTVVVTPSAIQNQIAVRQRAGLWFFQELWLRLEDLLGSKQVRTIGQEFLAAVPQLKSGEELERLLTLDPLTKFELENWHDLDIEKMLCLFQNLTQRKLGYQFTTDILEAILLDLPPELRSELLSLRSKIGLT